MGRPKKVKEEPKKVEPIVLEMGKAIDGKTWKGETFELTKTTHGILYHVYGGYSIFVTPNNVALYETLDDLIEHKDAYNKFTGKEKEDFELNVSAITYVLDTPLFAFSSAEFTFEIATHIIQYLQKVYDNAMNQPLQEETVKEDIEFKEATLALETIKDALNENPNS